MLTCPQFPGLNVYEHGLSVHEWFNKLQQSVWSEDNPLKVPMWYKTLWKFFVNPEDWETIKLYQTFHDCGKPFCRVVDENGKQHFPNHAEVSYQTWMQYAETEQDRWVGDLIRMDMDVHTAKGAAVDEFIQRPEAPILTLTGLAEIYANASHLGQLESDNFKIKFKQIDKIGKRLVAKRV
jgi:hypothetical protein